MAIEAQHSPAANYVGTFLLHSPSIHVCAYIFWEYLITSMSMAACCSLSVDRRHRWPPAAILSETTAAEKATDRSLTPTRRQRAFLSRAWYPRWFQIYVWWDDWL
jgi:hypothetical protein